MTSPPDDKNTDKEKPTVTLSGVVEKIVKSPVEPEKAQIAIEGAEHLYKEIRINNELKDGEGEKVKLKRGAEVNVTIEAPVDGVEKKTA